MLGGLHDPASKVSQGSLANGYQVTSTDLEEPRRASLKVVFPGLQGSQPRTGNPSGKDA